MDIVDVLVKAGPVAADRIASDLIALDRLSARFKIPGLAQAYADNLVEGAARPEEA